jgi:Zn-dependent protease
MTPLDIFLLVILIISVVIHEVAHGYAAYMQGDPTAYYEGRLTLNPLKHIDPIGSIVVPIITTLAGFPFGWAKPVPFNPYNLRNQRWGELIVAIAGPLSNILIAIVFGLLVRFGIGTISPNVLAISALIILVNLSLALFNLIPVPPLDGSKVLFNLLPHRFQNIRFKLEQFSFLLILVLIMVPQFSQFLGMLISVVFTAITGQNLGGFL